MVIALDTNIVIDFLSGEKSVVSYLKQFTKLILPVTVVGELLFGAYNSLAENNLKKTLLFINNCHILPIDKEAAAFYGQIRLKLKQAGTPIPENDIWIAATVTASKLTILTRDKHFALLPDIVQVKILQ